MQPRKFRVRIRKSEYMTVSARNVKEAHDKAKRILEFRSPKEDIPTILEVQEIRDEENNS